MLTNENNKTNFRPKFFAGFVLTILFLGFSAASASAQLCYKPPTIGLAPTETKSVGGVKVDYFAGGRENVQLTYEADVFNSKTKLTCHNLSLQISFFNYGNQPKIPESVELTFWSVANRMRYEDAVRRQLKIFADGSEIYAVELDRDFSEYKKNQSYSETLGTEFSFSILEKMAKAEKVKLVLGKVIVGLTAEDLQAVKQMVNLARAKN